MINIYLGKIGEGMALVKQNGRPLNLKPWKNNKISTEKIDKILDDYKSEKDLNQKISNTQYSDLIERLKS